MAPTQQVKIDPKSLEENQVIRCYSYPEIDANVQVINIKKDDCNKMLVLTVKILKLNPLFRNNKLHKYEIGEEFEIRVSNNPVLKDYSGYEFYESATFT